MSDSPLQFKLEGEEFILLQSLLKVSGLCETGGSAKIAITEGKVRVDGAVEIRRGKKIREGQLISFQGQSLKVSA